MKLDRINHYMRWQKLPGTLRKRVNDYYEYMWTCHAELSAKGLVDELPEPLQVEIRTLIKSRLIDSQPLFLHLEPDLMLRLVDALVSFVAIPHQQIVSEGEVGTRMYFLVSGEAIVYCARPPLDPELKRQREAAQKKSPWPLLRSLSGQARRWRLGRRSSGLEENPDDTPAIRKLRDTIRRNLQELVAAPRRDSMERALRV